MEKKFPNWVKTSDDYERWKRGEPSPEIPSTKTASKQCHACKMDIPKSASICPYCRTKAPSSVVGAIILVLVVLGFVGYISNNDKSSTTAAGKGVERQDTASETDAFYMSKQFVTKTLKAPSTADFGSFGESTITRKSDRIFSVTSFVDAQNSFGAKIRTYYTCDLQYLGKDNWQLIKLDSSNK